MKATANTSAPATTTKPAAPAPAPSTSAQSSSTETGPVSTTSSANATGETTSASATDSVSIKEGENNPYSAVAPYSEVVEAVPWTNDRTPEEGQVSRDDHLIGMLQNRGFSPEEIYRKDENGMSLLDRVAQENELKNPNLIQSGGSYVIPSKHEPKSLRAEQISQAMAESIDLPAAAQAESKTEVTEAENVETNEVATAGASSVHEDATAAGQASTTVGEAETVDANNTAAATSQSMDGDAASVTSAETTVGKAEEVEATNAAASGATSVNGDASTVAVANTTVGEAKEVDADNAALAQSQSTNGDSEANAATGNLVGTAGNVELDNQTQAEASSIEGEASAAAGNLTQVGEADTVQESTQVNAEAISAQDTAAAEAANEGVYGNVGELETESNVNASAIGGDGATATATNNQQVLEADKAHISNDTTASAAIPDSEQVAAASNSSEVAAKDAEGIEVEDTATATPDSAASNQNVSIAEHDGAVVGLDSTVLGPNGSSEQNVDIAGDGDSYVATTADATNVEQQVENHLEGGHHTVPTAGDADTTAELDSSSDGGTTNQSAEGVKNVVMETAGADLAMQSSDAVKADYSGQDTGRLNVVHEGRDGEVDVSASNADDVYFKDGPHVGIGMGQSTGNSISGSVEASNIRMDTTNSQDVNLDLQGTNGDDRHEVMLPTTAGEKPNQVSTNLGDGNDYFVAKNGNADLHVEKTSGDMNLSVRQGDGEQVATANHVFDAGTGNINGYVDLRNVDQSTVTIRAGEGDHEAKIQAGKGESDTIVFEVDGNDSIPELDHSGFENVIVIRDGKVEVLSGQAPSGLQ